MTPECIRSIVDEKKDKIIEEKDKAIEMLRAEVASLHEKLGKKNRGDGPYKATARARLFYIVELYVALAVMGILVKRWPDEKEKRKKGYRKSEINQEFQFVLSQHEGLKILLQKLNPDAKLDQFQEETMQLLRMAMPAETITLSGQKKPSTNSILKVIMTEREKEDLVSKSGSVQKHTTMEEVSAPEAAVGESPTNMDEMTGENQ